MHQLEEKLDELLVRKAPFQLPEGARRGLVTALPWLALVGGVLMLWAVWSLWQLVTWADSWVGLANSLSAAYGTGYVTPVSATPLVWLSLGILLIEAVLFFIAFPALREHRKRGWDLLLWVSLINIAQAVVQTVAYAGTGYYEFGSLLMALLGSLVGLYLLFQVRSHYTGAASVAAGAKGTMKVPKETPVSRRSNDSSSADISSQPDGSSSGSHSSDGGSSGSDS